MSGSRQVFCCAVAHFTLEARMTGLSFPGAEIEDFGDLVPPEKNTDAPEETVDENDKLEVFQASTGWPDHGFPPPDPDPDPLIG